MSGPMHSVLVRLAGPLRPLLAKKDEANPAEISWMCLIDQRILIKSS